VTATRLHDLTPVCHVCCNTAHSSPVPTPSSIPTPPLSLSPIHIPTAIPNCVPNSPFTGVTKKVGGGLSADRMGPFVPAAGGKRSRTGVEESRISYVMVAVSVFVIVKSLQYEEREVESLDT
jgi:hypothetical protein